MGREGLRGQRVGSAPAPGPVGVTPAFGDPHASLARRHSWRRRRVQCARDRAKGLGESNSRAAGLSITVSAHKLLADRTDRLSRTPRALCRLIRTR